MRKKNSCITPKGTFIYGIHKPSFFVKNLRCRDQNISLGSTEDGICIDNHLNFPSGDISIPSADWVYEIANPLPFRGTTYIDKGWADAVASGKKRICLAPKSPLSLHRLFTDNDIQPHFMANLPRQLKLSIAICSTDARDLVILADSCCTLIHDQKGIVTGLTYRDVNAKNESLPHPVPAISDMELFEAIANNPHLPDTYKRAMILRPGAQGSSPVSAEWPQTSTTSSHVYEYLRSNSYIAGGHYAANMAEDAIRYSIADLTAGDMHALRHLYYQRIFLCLAQRINLPGPQDQSVPLLEESMEQLRLEIIAKIDREGAENCASLWGWNFGFDYTPTDYRLHASHQQIHQQYATVPEKIDAFTTEYDTPTGEISSFCVGDLVTDAINDYTDTCQSNLFADYIMAIRNNTRMDGKQQLPHSLIVHEDEYTLLFVPKAQTSQWELQIMTKPDQAGHFPGNILECSSSCRRSLDTALLMAQQALAHMGATMVTSIEFSKRINDRTTFRQPLLYALLPKIPYSMGGFSEAQLRFICGHYPEDFAAACRHALQLK